jgi:predicted ATPase
LYPIIEHVQRALQFQPGDVPATKLDKLEQVLSGYSRPLEEVVPLYAALLSVPMPEERYLALNLSPQQQRQQTQDALVGWMLEEAERRPTLAMWEDLHWADPSTLEVLGLVLEQTPTVPMLHLLTFRPEFEPPWSTRSHMTPMTLNRLERPQVEALVTRLTRGKALPAEVVEYIVTKTDGVPLFVEELTKTLLTSELLHEHVDHYALTGPLSRVAIPDTLQASLMARLDQMNTAKEVAQLGAVVGREFPYALIQAISPQDETTLQAGLTQLIEAELLYQRGRPPRAKYLFKHALIQDAAYASLLKSTRQQVHQRIATLLEHQFPETVETQPELVARHFTEAQDDERAVHYWHEAGRRTVARSAHAEAVHHFTKGLEVLVRLPETVERTQQELTLQLGLGRSLMFSKGYGAPELEPVYTRAQTLCDQVGDTRRHAAASTALWSYYLFGGQLPKAREMAEQTLRQASSQTDPRQLVAMYNAMGQTCHAAGELVQAHTHFDEAIALYDRHDHRRTVTGVQDYGVTCRAYMALVLWGLGYPAQAHQRRHEALALARAVEHPVSLAVALVFSAMLSRELRQVQTVLDETETAGALCTSHEINFWLAQAMIYRGWALGMKGQGEEGIEQMRQGMAVRGATWAEAEWTRYPVMLAEVYGKMGQADQGITLLGEALARIDRHAYQLDAAERYRRQGELLLQRSPDAAADAELCFRHALDVSRRQQAKSLELRAATCLARLWQSQDKRQEAHDLLASVYAWFTEGFDTADLQEAQALLDGLA